LRKLTAVLALLAAALIVAGCGSNSSTTTTTEARGGEEPAAAETSAPALKVTAKAVSGLGPVLVNEEGKTLYVFAPDKHSKVTCEGSCAAVWPPEIVQDGQQALASGAVKQSLLGSDPDREGGEVITYAGWPLYAYVADTKPGVATGQAVDLNGGYWYVISPTGKVIK
jgi:predicted lipoprotein with Yx(FWY)xxD motif